MRESHCWQDEGRSTVNPCVAFQIYEHSRKGREREGSHATLQGKREINARPRRGRLLLQSWDEKKREKKKKKKKEKKKGRGGTRKKKKQVWWAKAA